MESVTIVIQCHNFERRLCWMLSSLLQQRGGPEIRVGLSHLNSDFINSTVKAFRGEGLFIISGVHESTETLQYRGVTRSDIFKWPATEYILFADTDHVYHPEFFARLAQTMDPTFEGMWTTGRYSCDPDRANAMVDDETIGYPCVIGDAWQTAHDSLNGSFMMRSNVGAGYFQLIRRDSPRHGGYYVRADECRDRGWKGKGQKARSDQQFRRRVGPKRRCIKWFSRNQIHLNHVRDNEIGHHTTIQR